MKKHIAIALSCCCLAATHTRLFAADVVIDTIVAVVNDGVVLASELESEVTFLKLQSKINNQALPSDEVFRERVLQRMIDQQIQRQHANKLGVVVDPSGVNRAIEQVAQGNNMSTQQFRQTLTAQGFNYEHYRKSIENELLSTRLVRRDVQSRIRVSKQEIDDFISAAEKGDQQQRYRVLHILVAVPPSAPQSDVDKAAARADAVLAQLKGGKDFAATAAANSDGARALEGGDLGWRVLQELPDFLSTALTSMSVGDISKPLRSPNGFHIVQLADKSNQQRQAQSETLARHIFFSTGSEKGEPQLNEIRQRIAAGESFEAMAAEFSEDPNSAGNGGELPWFTPGQMPEEIEVVAGKLEPGQISEPFRTGFGWHIIEVLDRRTRDNSADSARTQAELSLRQRKVEQATERWIRQLRDESFIEIRG